MSSREHVDALNCLSGRLTRVAPYRSTTLGLSPIPPSHPELIFVLHSLFGKIRRLANGRPRELSERAYLRDGRRSETEQHTVARCSNEREGGVGGTWLRVPRLQLRFVRTSSTPWTPSCTPLMRFLHIVTFWALVSCGPLFVPTPDFL